MLFCNLSLWTLASSAKYRIISHLFGVGQSICEIVHETCWAIVDYLLLNYIRFEFPSASPSSFALPLWYRGHHIRVPVWEY